MNTLANQYFSSYRTIRKGSRERLPVRTVSAGAGHLHLERHAPEGVQIATDSALPGRVALV